MLIGPLTAYFVDGRHEGRCVVEGSEWSLKACPFPMRSFEEYSLTPPGGLESRLAAARRALLEEKPDLLLTSAGESDWDLLAELVEQMEFIGSAADPRPELRSRRWRGREDLLTFRCPTWPLNSLPLCRARDPIARLHQLVAETGKVRFQVRSTWVLREGCGAFTTAIMTTNSPWPKPTWTCADATLTPAAFSVTSYDEGTGWTGAEIQGISVLSSGAVSVALTVAPSGKLVRIIARGTGPTPLLAKDDLVPLGAPGASGGDDGVDFVRMIPR